jgi:hypothetical protein
MILIDKTNKQITEDFTSKDLHTIDSNKPYKLDMNVINCLQIIKSNFDVKIKIIETFFDVNDPNKYKKIRFKFSGAGTKKAEKDFTEIFRNNDNKLYKTLINSGLKGVVITKNYIDISSGKTEKIDLPIEEKNEEIKEICDSQTENK